MNNETFDQAPIPKHMINPVEFLMDGMECEVVFNSDDEKILAVYLPNFVEMEITYSEPGLKGDTATNTLKPATVESGAEVRVPLFVNVGDKIKIDTRTKAYVERVKK